MTPKTKIIHIIHAVGGVEVSLRIILENLNPAKFENIIVHGKNDTQLPFLDTNGKPLKEYKIPIYRNISFINDIKSIYGAYKIIKIEEPNIIHSHSTKGGVIARIVGYFLNIKVIHSPQAFSYLASDNFFKKNIYLLIEKILSKTNSVLLACSPSEYNRAIKDVGYPIKRTFLINNSINYNSVSEPLTIPNTWQKNYICTVGRPCYQKNLEEMIKVVFELKKTQNIQLIIMGIGHFSDRLEKIMNLIEKLDLSQNIILLKWTSRPDVLNIIKNSRLYISTSRYEGLPYSIIESLSHSIPCVVSDCDGNRDLIINAENGFLVTPNNTECFKNHCLQLLNDDDLHQQMSKNARITFEQGFDINIQIIKLENIYNSLR